MHRLLPLCDWMILGALCAALGVGFLSYGAITDRGVALLALLCLATGALAVCRLLLTSISGRSVVRLATPARTAALCWAGFLAWTGVAALPLGDGIVASLSPAAAEWYAAWAPLIGIAPHLSVDPEATKRAWMLLIVLTAAGLAAAQFATTRSRRDRLVLLVLGFQGAAVAYAFLELAGFVGDPLGWRVPTGPLINRNHFAGLMIMAAPLAAGWAVTLSLRRAARRHRQGEPFDWHALLNSHLILWILLPVVICGTCVATLSRSGLASCSAAMLIWMAMVARHSGPRLAARIAAGVVVLGALFVALTGLEPVTQRFDELGIAFDVEAPYSRAQIWAAAARAYYDFPLTGTGLGSFYGIYMPYAAANTEILPIHAHSDWLQVLVETGLPGFLLVLAGLLFLCREVVDRIASADGPEAPLIAGALAGIVGMALQSLGEFALRLPYVALQFVLLIAIALGQGVSSRELRRGGTQARAPIST